MSRGSVTSSLESEIVSRHEPRRGAAAAARVGEDGRLSRLLGPGQPVHPRTRGRPLRAASRERPRGCRSSGSAPGTRVDGLTGAEKTGKTAVLTYTSCGSGSAPRLVPRDDLALERARHRPAPSVRRSPGRHAAPSLRQARRASPGRRISRARPAPAVYVFTGKAAISLANDITLEAIPISRVEAVSKLVRPLPPAKRLPPPAYDTRRLLAACAERTPGPAKLDRCREATSSLPATR